MNICGIVAEYNPLHNGHMYQLNKAKEITNSKGIVLVMSGNFVQRGQVALLNKHQRAMTALASGVDLVIELPTYFATSSAEPFAHHAISILHHLGVVTHLNFGSESGNLEPIIEIANILYDEPKLYKQLLHDQLALGKTYPKARQAALNTYKFNDNHLSTASLAALKTPNNILGIEYLKALKRLNSSIIPTTTKRIGSTYHDDSSESPIPSATAIRKHLANNLDLDLLTHALPKPSYLQLQSSIKDGTGPLFMDSLYEQLKYKLLISTPKELSLYQDVTEGLENRINNVVKSTYSYTDLIDAIISKRYTRTKITRALTHIYLGHTKENFNQFSTNMSPYINVLGFTKNGQKILKYIKEYDETLPIIVNRRQGYKKLDPLQKKSFEADLNSSLIYNHLIYKTYNTILQNDYQIPVIKF